jgi:hypothetical protein
MGYEWRAVCKKGVRTQLFRNPLRKMSLWFTPRSRLKIMV